MPDLDRGLAEVARVLRHGGALIAVTNAPDHLQELWELAGIERWDHGWNFTQRPVAYDFALDSTFRSRADLDAYGPHPAHQAAIVKLREVADWVLCDFEPQ